MQSKYKFLTQVKKYKVLQLVAAVFAFNPYNYNEHCDKFLHHKDFNKTFLTGKHLKEFSLGISVLYVCMCQCACIHPINSI